MDRQGEIQSVVDRILTERPDLEVRRSGYVHLYGVSSLCSMLALRRGLNAELSSIAGLLHDIATYSRGSADDHALHGSLMARAILLESGRFSDDEVELVSGAILHHSQKDEVHDPYSELLKDADVLQHHLHNTARPVPFAHLRRIDSMYQEMGLSRPV